MAEHDHASPTNAALPSESSSNATNEPEPKANERDAAPKAPLFESVITDDSDDLPY